jgi:hypothetical protein
MSYSTTPGDAHSVAGVLDRLRTLAAQASDRAGRVRQACRGAWRSFAFGSARPPARSASSCFSPLAVALLGRSAGTDAADLRLLVLLVLPLPSRSRRRAGHGTRRGVPQSFREALGEAFGHGSYVLLVLGFFTCGFHVAFITTHLPPYCRQGARRSWGGWVLASSACSTSSARSRRHARQQIPEALSALVIYFLRAIAIAAFVLAPVTPRAR